MKKILLIDSFAGIGGGQQVLHNLVTGLSNDFDLTVMAPSGLYMRKYKEAGAKTVILKKTNGFIIVKQIKRYIENETFDIIHAHGTRAAIWARLALVLSKVKPSLVYTVHGLHIVRRKTVARFLAVTMERLLNHKTNRLVCVSNSDKELIIKNKLIQPSKIAVVRNGIEVSKFTIPEAYISKKKLKLDLENIKIIVSVGRLHEQKDFATLINSVKYLENMDFKLLIIGDGELRGELEAQVKSLSLDEKVVFLGFQEDIPSFLAMAEIVILSSLWEGLPLVPLEAGAAKKTVIASDIEGNREAVVNEQTGLLFKTGCAKDLADKIIKLLENPKLNRQLGENAFNRIVKYFSVESMTEGYKKLYLSLK